MTEATKGQRWRRTQSTEEPPRFRPVQNPEPRLPPLEGRKASPQMEPPPVPQSNPWPLDHLPDDASRAPSIVAKARPSFRQTSTAQHEDRSHEFAPTLHAPEPEEYQDDVERYEPAKRSSGRGILYACIGFFAGVAFWHAVGFWQFVEEAVFSGPRQQATQSLDTPATRSAAERNEFDEERFAKNPPASSPSTSGMTTGSISPVRPVNPGTTTAAPSKAFFAPQPTDTETAPPPNLEAIRPGGLSWSPAVKTSE